MMKSKWGIALRDYLGKQLGIDSDCAFLNKPERVRKPEPKISIKLSCSVSVIEPHKETNVTVVLAIFKQSEKYLIQYNKPHDIHALPGGKVHHNESPEEGLKREMKEELGVDVVEFSLVKVTKENYTKTTEALYYVYRIDKWEGDIKNVLPEVHPEQKFASIDDIKNLAVKKDEINFFVKCIEDTNLKQGGSK